jgi:hypothetical protein
LSQKNEETGEWRKLHNEELIDLHFLYSIVRVVRARRMRGRNKYCVWEWREVYGGCWWERGYWGDSDVDGRIILRWILRKFEVLVGTGWSRLWIGTGGWQF